MKIKALIQRNPTLFYFLIVFSISWGSVFLGMGPAFSQGEELAPEDFLIWGLLMVAGPSIAGIFVIYLTEGRKGLQDFYARLTRWRVGIRWYAPLLIFPLLILVTLIPLSHVVSSDLAPTIFPFGLLIGLMAGFLEEIGWTGFAYPTMKKKYGVLGASIILGFIHAVWHIPADFLGNSIAFGDHWLPYMAGFFIFVMALRVLMGWVYENTKSLFLGQLMHASSTGFLSVLLPIGIGGLNWTIFYAAYAIILWGAVVIVIARHGEKLLENSQANYEEKSRIPEAG